MACLVHLVLGLLLYEPAIFPGGDNAGYMILGESLRTGQGFRDLHLPAEPLHTKYPPLYPALLAVLGWFGGLQLFKLASLALTTGAVALTWTVGRRWASPPVAVGGAVVMAVNPVLLEYAHWTLSEPLFLLLILASLWAYGREESATASPPEPGGPADPPDGPAGPEEGSVPGEGAGLAAAAAAFLTRTAGLPLLLAAALRPVLERRWRRTAAAVGVLVAAGGGWSLYQRLAAPGRADYLRELLMVNPYDPAAGTVGPVELVTRGAGNLWRYASEVFPGAVTGMGGATGQETGWLAVAGLVLSALAAWGWFSRAYQRVRTPELFTFFYVGLIAVWPSVWTDRRYLLPLLPLLVLYALRGAEEAGARAWERLPGRGRRAGAEGAGGGNGGPAAAPGGTGRLAGLAGAALLLVLPALWSNLSLVPERIRCVADYRTGTPCLPAPYLSFFEAADWTRSHTPDDAVVVNRKPRLFYWRARRQGTVYPYSSEPEIVLRGLESAGADYVVVDAISGTTPRYLVPAVQARPDRFEVVHRVGRPATWVLRFLPEAKTASRVGDRRGGRDPGPAPEGGALAGPGSPRGPGP